MVRETKQNKKTSFNEIKGFLSLQLKLRLELGFRLRLTKNTNPFYNKGFVQWIISTNLGQIIFFSIPSCHPKLYLQLSNFSPSSSPKD
jgi:hypothetical protein